MKNLKEVAKKFLNNGLNPVPTGDDKLPVRRAFNTERFEEHELDNFEWKGIAVVCGSFSQGLEVLDFDLKNAPDPAFIMKEFKKKVNKDLLNKLYVETTPSGGYHFFYRCIDVTHSLKLAVSEDDEIIIETRGEGSMAKTYPSEGYKALQGSIESIPIITSEERLELLVSCKLLSKGLIKKAKKELSRRFVPKFAEYNADPDIGLAMLEAQGWTVFKHEGDRVLMTKPDSQGKVSAIYNIEEVCFFWVYSTSTQFESEKAYKNSDLFCELECDGRYNVGYAKLFDEGHGSEDDKEITFELSLQNLSFVSEQKDEKDYLERAIKDEIPEGLTTGWSELDKNFRFKRNHLAMGVGFEGVGKSVMMLNLAVASNVLHGWKWGMVLPENRTAFSRRRLLEILTGKELKHYKHSRHLLKPYEDQLYNNFFITSNKRYGSIKEALEMGRKLYENKQIDALLLDPYNFFRVDANNQYAWDNEVLSLMRVFVEKYCTIYLMLHPRSDAGRTAKDPEGYLLPCNQYSVTGGNNFVNRGDDFFGVHRIKNHRDADIQKITQFIVYKIKEEETGGKVHALGEYTELRYDTVDGFTGFFDCKNNNPMKGKGKIFT